MLGAITVIIAIIITFNAMKVFFTQPTDHGMRIWEAIFLYSAGTAWFGYSAITSTYTLGIISILMLTPAIAWLSKHVYLVADNNQVFAVITPPLLVTLMTLIQIMTYESVSATVFGWIAFSLTTMTVLSLIIGYISKREELYPVSGTTAIGVTFAGAGMLLHSLAELGHLIPFITSFIIILLGIIMIYPAFFGIIHATAAHLASATGEEGVNQEKVKQWAENKRDEARRFKQNNKNKGIKE